MDKLAFKLILCVFLLCFGCTHAPQVGNNSVIQKISKDYLAKINKNDGITQKEALLLAQNHLIFIGRGRDYTIDRPLHDRSSEEQWTFRFYPVSKTLADSLHKPEILVTIDRNSGEADVKKDYQKKL